MDLAWKGDDFPDMRCPTDPGHEPFDTQAKPRMDEGSVLPEIEVPPIGLGVEPLVTDSTEELVVIILTL